VDLKRIILLIIFTLSAAAVSGSDSMVYFERIEFRGVKNVDKYEIIRNAKAKVSEKGIVIDVDYLKEVMDSSIMIENYDVDIENNLLIITVEEKYPLFMVLKVEKNISVPCLVDEKRNVLDSGRFFRTDMPIIIVEKDFFENDDNFSYLKGLFDNLTQIGNEKSNFSGELAEIEIYPGRDLRVKLKSRKTDFIIKNELNGFRKIEKSAAYLDAVNTYPERLDLKDKRVLIRQ
jgi:hypothetical protein